MGNLSERWSLDFINDGKADNTGSTDCTPALDRIRAIFLALAADPRLPKQTCEFVIPPGLYLFGTKPLVWTFPSPSPTRLIVRGFGDASIFIPDMGSDGTRALLSVANTRYTDIRDLCVVGGQDNAATAECDFLFNIQGGDGVEISHCRICGVHAAANVLLLGTRNNRVIRSDVSGCAGNGGTGTIFAFGGLVMEDCQMQDLPIVNGWSTDFTQKGVTSRRHVTVNLGPGVGPTLSTRITRSFYDANCNQALVIVGDPASPAALVKFEDSSFSFPGNGITAGLPHNAISDVNRVEIDGYYYNNTGAPGPLFPSLALSNVRSAQLDLLLNAVGTCNYVTADAGCGVVDFVGGQPSVSLLQSSAARTTVDAPLTAGDLGALADVRSAGQALEAFELVKASAIGVIEVQPSDDASVVLGPVLEAVEAGDVPCRVARTAQPVPMLSDGSVAIVVGDRIVVSPETPGRVTSSLEDGASSLGSALTGAAATADAIVQVQYDKAEISFSPESVPGLVADYGSLFVMGAGAAPTNEAAIPLKGNWGTSAADQWAVGSDAAGLNGKILHWNGSAWSVSATIVGALFRAVWGASVGDVWAVGVDVTGLLGLIYHWNGAAWSLSASVANVVFRDVWGSASDDVWAVGTDNVGANGKIYHWDGTSWSLATTVAGNPFQAVWANSTADAWAVGSDAPVTNGRIYHWDGVSWSLSANEAGTPLTAVWGNGSSDVWAVGNGNAGADGKIYHWNGAAWAGPTTEVGQPLTSVWGASSRDVYATSSAGQIFHWEGTAWSLSTNVGAFTLANVWGSGARDVWVVGQNAVPDGKIWHLTTIAAWLDQSTTGDPLQHAVQTTAAAQPAYVASDPGFASREIVQFVNASGDFLQSGVWASALPQPSTVLVVGSETGANKYWLDGATANQAAMLDGAGSAQIYAGAGPLSDGALGTGARIFVGVFAGASSAIYLSALTAAATGNAGATARTGITLGAAGNGTVNLDGKLARVLVYNRVLNAAELNALVAGYLGPMYGITIGP